MLSIDHVQGDPFAAPSSLHVELPLKKAGFPEKYLEKRHTKTALEDLILRSFSKALDFGDMFGDIFGDFFGGGSRRGASNGPMKGANLRTSVRITFEEAVFGCEKEIDMVLKDECTTCSGTGAKPGTSPETCTKCGGKGKVVFSQQSLFGMVQNVQTCPLSIPAGIDTLIFFCSGSVRRRNKNQHRRW